PRVAEALGVEIEIPQWPADRPEHDQTSGAIACEVRRPSEAETEIDSSWRPQRTAAGVESLSHVAPRAAIAGHVLPPGGHEAAGPVRRPPRIGLDRGRAADRDSPAPAPEQGSA